MDSFDAILIAGPTASGKSSLAIGFAETYGGVVINADSMQVYSELRILTARPSEEDEARVPHVMYGVVPASQAYSTGQWADDVAGHLARAREDGQLPVIVGGTGLYFNALLEGLSPIPDIPDDIREKWRAIARTTSGPELHKVLASHDPEMADILRPSDRQRLVRALEVMEATGVSLKVWQKEPGKPLLDFGLVKAFVAAPERDILYKRCDQRFDMMIAEGALCEVERLMTLGLPDDLPIMRALGVRPLRSHLLGEISLDEALEQSKRDTRRYAKRQMTWARGNMLAWEWLSAQDMKSLRRGNFTI